jgi:hypothetical protein
MSRPGDRSVSRVSVAAGADGSERQPEAGSNALRDLFAENGDRVDHGLVYLERALVNPAGADPDREAVVHGNLSTGSVDLTGWRLQDANGWTSPLTATIPAGASLIFEPDGTAVQLGNKRGNLPLVAMQGT